MPELVGTSHTPEQSYSSGMRLERGPSLIATAAISANAALSHQTVSRSRICSMMRPGPGDTERGFFWLLRSLLASGPHGNSGESLPAIVGDSRGAGDLRPIVIYVTAFFRASHHLWSCLEVRRDPMRLLVDLLAIRGLLGMTANLVSKAVQSQQSPLYRSRSTLSPPEIIVSADTRTMVVVPVLG
jgi:hypothetical protein